MDFLMAIEPLNSHYLSFIGNKFMREAKEMVIAGLKLGPNFYAEFFSHAKLSDERKEKIESRRDALKVFDDDLPVVAIVVKELLSYKPRLVTLHDRYLQLEMILDAVDKSRKDKNENHLVLVCKKIAAELAQTPTRLNLFERCLSEINAKIAAHYNLASEISWAKL
jgi:hypothetical protein